VLNYLMEEAFKKFGSFKITFRTTKLLFVGMNPDSVMFSIIPFRQ